MTAIDTGDLVFYPWCHRLTVCVPLMSTLDAREVYEALAVTGEARAHGIEIRCTSRGDAISYAVTYNSIHRVSYDRGTWTRIFMWASRLTIEIRGRNLRPIIDSIRTRTCGFIQEYSQDEHVLPQPEDPSAPFIKSISVVTDLTNAAGSGFPETWVNNGG